MIRSIINIRLIVAMILTALVLVGCPVILEVDLRNSSENPISVVYSTGNRSVIEPGDTSRELVNNDCIVVESGDETYEFFAPWPEEDFVNHTLTKNRISAEFDKKNRLVIFDSTKSIESALVLKVGCD